MVPDHSDQYLLQLFKETRIIWDTTTFNFPLGLIKYYWIEVCENVSKKRINILKKTKLEESKNLNHVHFIIAKGLKVESQYCVFSASEGIQPDAVGAVPVGLEPELRMQEFLISIRGRRQSVPDRHHPLRVSAQQVPATPGHTQTELWHRLCQSQGVLIGRVNLLVQVKVDPLVGGHVPFKRKHDFSRFSQIPAQNLWILQKKKIWRRQTFLSYCWNVSCNSLPNCIQIQESCQKQNVAEQLLSLFSFKSWTPNDFWKLTATQIKMFAHTEGIFLSLIFFW